MSTNPISQISPDLIPLGKSDWGVHRDRVPLRLGKATVTRDQNSIIIHGKVAGLVNAELTISVDQNDPNLVTATVTRHKFSGTLAQQGDSIVFTSDRGTVTLAMQKKRLYVTVDGFGAGSVSNYYLSR